MFSWSSLPRPILALAPMADMTDRPFCMMCKRFGDPIIFREMVSAEAIVRRNDKTWHMAAFDARERPIVQQIFGNDPATMARAAALIEERLHPDGIDINMGCPVHKITSNFDGASLLREPERAAAIVRAVKAAVSIPVSVKTRLGWNNKTDVSAFVRKLKLAGVDLITIHGRTKEQGHAGHADWAAVGAARDAVPGLPVLVNGDIVDADTARRALADSRADGVMIGRGALGCPWIFGLLDERTGLAAGGTGESAPAEHDLITTVLDHARLQIEHYGERGLIKLRKHLPYYFKGDPRWKGIRASLVRVSTMRELEEILGRSHAPS